MFPMGTKNNKEIGTKNNKGIAKGLRYEGEFNFPFVVQLRLYHDVDGPTVLLY